MCSNSRQHTTIRSSNRASVIVFACTKCGATTKQTSGERLRAVNFIDKNVGKMDRWKFIERETYVQLLIKTTQKDYYKL